jgi:hypothetical protein
MTRKPPGVARKQDRTRLSPGNLFRRSQKHVIFEDSDAIGKAVGQ